MKKRWKISQIIWLYLKAYYLTIKVFFKLGIKPAIALIIFYCVIYTIFDLFNLNGILK